MGLWLRRSATLLAAVVALSTLQGCAGIIVAGAAGTASMLHDRRSMTQQVEDTQLEFDLASALSESDAIRNQARVRVFVLNGKVLLVGQAPTSHLMSEIKRISASKVTGNSIHNELQLKEPISLTTRSSDSWLSTKVRSTLLADEDTEFARLRIIIEDGRVYLMGLLTHAEADVATEIVRKIEGVKEVIRVFEFVSE
ncbi:BON domain-containing protein [Neiella marina]|uniref:BON domain-containing protein n=1 Tax=Neiella holothuriorum TaxID=2870530 RepID=A0ABS7EAY6_9GAMM|nr:BON domain-containing protein [Neiella holothuriorum]MBW8189498.1 BON domain-containing protein [Neiella holothuriorum]